MKILTLFDDDGKVLALFYPALRTEGHENGPVVAFSPEIGQHAAELEVPTDLKNVELRDLHGALRVDMQGEYRRLIHNTSFRPAEGNALNVGNPLD
jgi:hypothetical protein